MSTREIGRGITIETKGDKVYLELDVSGPGVLSASEKNMVICTTSGNTEIQVGNRIVKLGVNLYTPVR